MPGSAKAAALALFAATAAYKGVELFFIRGTSAKLLAAVPARPTFMMDDGAGPRIETEAHDWLVRSDDLDFGPGPTMPQEGDRLQTKEDRPLERAGLVYTYELTAPPYRRSDSLGAILRLHSHLIAVT